MSHFVRSSKYRNVFADSVKADQHHLGVKAIGGTTEGNNLCGNKLFVGVAWSGGGGPLAIINNEQQGRLPASVPCLVGHKDKVNDWSFNPFDDHQVLTASDDCSLKLWGIPEGGLKENCSEFQAHLEGHQKRVNVCAFHKVAEGIATSASHDKTMKIWDLKQSQETQTIEVPEPVLSFSYNLKGNTFVASAKDKMMRIFDPRSGECAETFQAFEGTKPAKVVWCGRKDRIVCTGFSRQSDRIIKLYDPRNTSEALKKIEIDTGAGVLLPMYCEDTSVLFVAGKGDMSVKLYELSEDGNEIFFLTQASASNPQKGACLLPKMAGNISKHEIARICRLAGTSVEVMPLLVPRKATEFQDDIFPDTFSPEPALTSEEWLSGKDAEPKTMSVKDAVAGVATDAAPTPRKQFKGVLQLQKEVEEKDKRIAELEAQLAALQK